MVVPLRIEPSEARRRFDKARELVVRSSPQAGLLSTLDRLDRSLATAFDGRARLVEAARQLDQGAVDQELKQALRRLGPDAPQVATIRRRRQSAITVQDEIDAVDQHVHATIVEVEALAAQVHMTSTHLSSEAATDIGDRLEVDLEQLKEDAAALEAARRELEGL